jgi:hypothetical protein
MFRKLISNLGFIVVRRRLGNEGRLVAAARYRDRIPGAICSRAAKSGIKPPHFKMPGSAVIF